MSKAVQGAAMLGGALALGGAAFLDPALVASPLFDKLLFTLAFNGIAMEAGAIADALTQNRGTGVTIRQPAANRNYVYGNARVGGVAIYQSTTGGHHDQYNFVIVLADHQCNAIVNLFLDGRQVIWSGSGPGWTIRNGFGFGGNADNNTHTDEGNNRYNFGGLVYAEARFGDQLPGDVMASLTANDGKWVATSGGSPYVGGCTYIYLKVEYDTAMFPQVPEIRVTVQGKNDIYDPRTGTTGYTENWALCVADVLTNVRYGVGEQQANLNTAQLIAAANVCDELVPLADGESEKRYTCNGQGDTAQGPGDLLASMMPAAQGRLSYIGGEWYIFPAYWQGPSFTFGESDVLKDFTWTAARPLKERYNRVAGTFIAPRFPFAVSGDLYDSNGFYDNTRANLFGLEWMPESYPMYAQDALHGYPSDAWLTADQGYERWLNIEHKWCISLAASQRLAKIALLRNRLGAGSTTLTMSVAAWQAIPCDLMQFDFAPFGWQNKMLEIAGVQFRIEPGDSPDEGVGMMVDLSVQETDPSIYEWNAATEELTINETSASLQLYSFQVQAPSSFAATNGASTAVITPDGVTRPRIGVSWQPAPDGFVSQYQLQMQPAGAATWLDAGMVDAANQAAYIGNVIGGQSYNLRLRALTPRGAASAWVQIAGHAVAPLYSQVNSLGIAPGLVSVAPNTAAIDSVLSGSTATVRVHGPGGVGTSFTQYLGSQSITLPAASFTGKATATSYDVLYNTTTATYLIVVSGTTPSDAYVYIGSVATVSAAGTGGTAGGGGSSPYRYAS